MGTVGARELWPLAGPTLADIGVQFAVQGGRQRLTPAQHGAAVRALDKCPGGAAASR